MIFDDLLKSDVYFRFSPTMLTDWRTLSNTHIWAREPLECIFEVSGSLEDGITREKNEVFLDCIKECGGHSMASITREMFETLEAELSRSPFESVSVSDCLAILDMYPGEKELAYSFEDTVAEILEMIEENKLPVFRKRGQE